MSARAKFLFDTDFAPGAAQRHASVPLAQHRAALAEAEAQGRANGVAAGRAEAAAESERRMAVAFERMAASVEALAQDLAQIERRLEAEAVGVAVATARKLAAGLVAREPLADVAALAGECFRHLVGAAHVVVRVNDAAYDAARGRLEEIAQRNGFEGRLVVLAEPEIGAGDCKVEWADGGAVLDRAAIDAAITGAVERYLAVRREAAAELRSAAP